MGRNCKVCGGHRPHECFGGKGLRSVVCNRCRKLPKSDQESFLLTDEIVGFMYQSNISKKNMERLRKLQAMDDGKVAELATIVLQIAHIKPTKKKRSKLLFEKFRHLHDQAHDLGLIEEFIEFDDLDPEIAEEYDADQDDFDPDCTVPDTLDDDDLPF
jgi:hypothetical protein